jgi:hypothetical protein
MVLASIMHSCSSVLLIVTSSDAPARCVVLCCVVLCCVVFVVFLLLVVFDKRNTHTHTQAIYVHIAICATNNCDSPQMTDW